jgi:hypothetical protein
MLYKLFAQFSTPENLPQLEASQVVGGVLTVVYWMVGVLSVIFIIIGGFKYVTSGGDPKNTASAKNTILYAVVGVVVAILAFAIVNFVIEGVE